MSQPIVATAKKSVKKSIKVRLARAVPCKVTRTKAQQNAFKSLGLTFGLTLEFAVDYVLGINCMEEYDLAEENVAVAHYVACILAAKVVRSGYCTTLDRVQPDEPEDSEEVRREKIRDRLLFFLRQCPSLGYRWCKRARVIIDDEYADKAASKKATSKKSESDSSESEESKKPASKKPVSKKAVSKKPEAEKPEAEKPEAEKPEAEKPVSKKPEADSSDSDSDSDKHVGSKKRKNKTPTGAKPLKIQRPDSSTKKTEVDDLIQVYDGDDEEIRALLQQVVAKRAEREEEQKRKEAEEAERKCKEEKAERQRKEEEERKRREEKAERRRKEAEAAEQKRKEAEAAEQKRKEAEAAEQKRKDDEERSLKIAALKAVLEQLEAETAASASDFGMGKGPMTGPKAPVGEPTKDLGAQKKGHLPRSGLPVSNGTSNSDTAVLKETRKPAPVVDSSNLGRIPRLPASAVLSEAPKPAPAVSNGASKPAPAVSNGASKPAPAASNGTSKPAPAVSNGASKPAPAVSNGASKPAPAASNGTSKPAPAASNGASKPAPAASNGTSKPAPAASREIPIKPERPKGVAFKNNLTEEWKTYFAKMDICNAYEESQKKKQAEQKRRGEEAQKAKKEENKQLVLAIDNSMRAKTLEHRARQPLGVVEVAPKSAVVTPVRYQHPYPELPSVSDPLVVTPAQGSFDPAGTPMENALTGAAFHALVGGDAPMPDAHEGMVYRPKRVGDHDVDGSLGCVMSQDSGEPIYGWYKPDEEQNGIAGKSEPLTDDQAAHADSLLGVGPEVINGPTADEARAALQVQQQSLADRPLYGDGSFDINATMLDSQYPVNLPEETGLVPAQDTTVRRLDSLQTIADNLGGNPDWSTLENLPDAGDGLDLEY